MSIKRIKKLKLYRCKANNAILPTAEQQAVINDFDNNILLFASAGTGKTFIIAKKVTKAISSGYCRINEILCLTFTVRASDEMREDISRFAAVGDINNKVTVKTIHSFAYSILAEESALGADVGTPYICDNADREQYIRQAIADVDASVYLSTLLRDNNISADWLHAQLRVYIDIPEQHTSSTFRSGLYWLVDNGRIKKFIGVGKYPLYWDGELLYYYPRTDKISGVKGVKADFFPSKFTCYYCGDTICNGKSQCPHCGGDYSAYLSSRNAVDYERYSASQQIIEELKRYREIYGFKSCNELKDMQDTHDYIVRYNKPLLRHMHSYYFNSHEQATDCNSHEQERVQYEQLCRSAGAITARYNEIMRTNDRMDFTDIVIKARDCLASSKTLHKWQSKYKLIFVDEVQDTSVLEYIFLSRIMSGTLVNVCGDFYQTIYEWRGSDPVRTLRQFVEDFDLVTYMLSENYRSSKSLTSASIGYLTNAFGDDIYKYLPADMHSHSDTNGDIIEFHNFVNLRAETSYIYQYLLNIGSDEAAHCAIMCRSRKYIADLYKGLMRIADRMPERDKLSFFTAENDYEIFDKAYMKDFISCIRIVMDSNDRASLISLVASGKFSTLSRKDIDSIERSKAQGNSISSFIDCGIAHYAAQQPTSSGIATDSSPYDSYAALITAYESDSIIVYDLETTGLDSNSDVALQIAAVRMGRSGVVEEFNRLIIPTVPICPEAQKVHGKSLELLQQNGGQATDVYRDYLDFTAGCVVVGYNNLRFDTNIIDRQIAELNAANITCNTNAIHSLAMHKSDNLGDNIAYDNECDSVDTHSSDNDMLRRSESCEYDALLLAKQYISNVPNYKLSTICEHYGIINEVAHDALSDVRATGEIVSRIIEQNIINTTDFRTAQFARYNDAFVKFRSIYSQLRNLLRHGSVNQLVDEIISSCRLTRYGDNACDLIRKHFYCNNVSNSYGYWLQKLTDISLAPSKMNEMIAQSGKVAIITVHQSKGCEYNNVIMAGVSNNQYPTASAHKSGMGAIAEEKRLFYVAMTRAKCKLIMTNHGNVRYEKIECNHVDNTAVNNADEGNGGEWLREYAAKQHCASQVFDIMTGSGMDSRARRTEVIKHYDNMISDFVGFIPDKLISMIVHDEPTGKNNY